MARKSKRQINEDIVNQGKNDFSTAESAEYDNREICREDRKFSQVAGEMWDQRFKQDRDKPRFEINRVAHAVNQVVGEYARNSISTKVRPNNGAATVDIANTYNGLIRNIYAASHFDYTQLQAFKETCHGGFAAWRVINDFLDDETFEQGVCIGFIADAINRVWFDPTDTDPLKRNAGYCFVVSDIAREKYKELYPDSAVSSFDNARSYERLISTGWGTNETVRVAEYFKKVPRMRTIIQLNDGSTVFEDEITDVIDEMAQRGIQEVNRRRVKYDEIRWVKMNGVEVLEGPIILPGKYIPVVPVYGYSVWIDKTHIYHGMVRPAKDPSRLYNYNISASVEAAANSPLDPIFVTPNQVAGFEDSYINAPARNTPFLFWNQEAGEAPPFRLGPPPVQSALIEQAGRSERDIQATLGRNDAALGDVPMGGAGTPSGLALNRAQSQSNLGQEELFSNMGNAVEYTGEILVDLIPKVYSQEMQLRILNQDGTSDFVPINKQIQDVQTGETVIVNDMNQGRYDVEVTLSPSFETQRQETIAMLTALAGDNPAFLQVTGDILAKSMDFPEAEEISKRVRKQMLQQGVIEPNEEEQKEIEQKKANTPPDPMEQLNIKVVQLQAEQLAASVDLAEAQILKQQAEIQKILAEADNTEVKSVTDLMDSITKSIEAGIRDNQNAVALLQEQMAQTQQAITDTIPEQLNAAFQGVRPGLYQTDDGTIVEVGPDGQMLAPQAPPQGLPS